MKPRFFASPAAFTEWLEKNHAKKTEVFVGYYKKATGRPSLTWSQAVDCALCYGWIDSVLRSLGPESHMQRFTPRRKGSNWSNVNVRKVAELEKSGRMRPAGRAAFEARTAPRTGTYSFEEKPAALAPKYVAKLKTNPRAWKYFETQAPSYQRAAAFWVMGAKREETREKRLADLIADSARGMRAKPFRI